MLYQVTMGKQFCQQLYAVISQRMPVQVIDKKSYTGMPLHPLQLPLQFFIGKVMTE